jgi:hypothetical protein
VPDFQFFSRCFGSATWPGARHRFFKFILQQDTRKGTKHYQQRTKGGKA